MNGVQIISGLQALQPLAGPHESLASQTGGTTRRRDRKSAVNAGFRVRGTEIPRMRTLMLDGFREPPWRVSELVDRLILRDGFGGIR